jgi:hypothetical protein
MSSVKSTRPDAVGDKSSLRFLRQSIHFPDGRLITLFFEILSPFIRSQESLFLNPVTVIDTAGIRNTEDPVEQEGVRRARARAAEADLVLWLNDCDEASLEILRSQLLAFPDCGNGPL